MSTVVSTVVSTVCPLSVHCLDTKKNGTSSEAAAGDQRSNLSFSRWSRRFLSSRQLSSLSCHFLHHSRRMPEWPSIHASLPSAQGIYVCPAEYLVADSTNGAIPPPEGGCPRYPHEFTCSRSPQHMATAADLHLSAMAATATRSSRSPSQRHGHGHQQYGASRRHKTNFPTRRSRRQPSLDVTGNRATQASGYTRTP